MAPLLFGLADKATYPDEAQEVHQTNNFIALHINSTLRICHSFMMRSLFSVVFLLLAAFATAISTAGNRLLAVLDDVAEKDAYSKFFGDLTGES